MHEISLSEAKNKLTELVDEALKGEEVLIKKDSHSIVKLVAMKTSGKPRFGSARNLIEIGPDFDAPLPDFESYS